MITGEHIREVRERLGDSQAAFARRIGVNQSTVWRWERHGDGRLNNAPFAQRALQRILDELRTEVA